MGKRRSMMRKKKYDDRNTKPWSDVNHDVLFVVMMKLGVDDFVAFSRVCKSWRSVAVSNRNKFIVSRPPMSISFSYYEKVSHYLEDCKGKKFKITLPHTAYRWFYGVTCGYVVLHGEKTKDFWLVNPITKHQLHFPNVPDKLYCCSEYVRAILVFSPLISELVFVVLNVCPMSRPCVRIWFCIAGKQEWTYVPTSLSIQDLHAFKGKIYTVHNVNESDEVGICEMKLFPEPEFVLLETGKFPKPVFELPRFVSSGENLYVIDPIAKHPYKIHEIDVEAMKWVSREKVGEEYVFFFDKSTDGYFDSQYGRYVVTNENGKGGSFYAHKWYFFFDWLNVDLLHE